MAYVINRGSKGRPLWYCKFRDIDGKWKQRATHQPTLKEAQRFALELEARIARGQIGIPETSPQEQKQRTITVDELAQRFLAEYDRPTLRSRDKYMEFARSSCKARLFSYPIAKLPAASARRLDVIQYRDALRRHGYKPKTVNISLGWLSVIYNWAIEMELIDCRNPVARVERMPTRPSEEHYTREQIATLLDPERRHPMIATALYTGMRKGELFGLRWECVRFDLGVIEIKRSFNGPPKNGRARTIPLHPELAPILIAWQACCPPTPERVVFPVEVRGRYRAGSRPDMAAVREVLAAAGCPGDLDRPWHAMRHTFATMFCEAGGARDAIERILGHSTGGNAVTTGYLHASMVYLAREMARLTLVPSQPPAQVYNLDAYRQPA